MTMSPVALDVEALYLGSSFLMADPMGPLLDQDEEEILSPSLCVEEKAPPSPPLSFSSSSYMSSLSPYETLLYSPPPSPLGHSSFVENETKADSESLCLGAGDLLDTPIGADDGKDDGYLSMEWMEDEKIDLSGFDLDSLIGSCESDESPSSPEDFLNFNSDMDLDLDSFGPAVPAPHDGLDLPLPCPVPSLPLEVPLPEAAEAKMTETAPHQEPVMKSEPPSPPPSPPSPPPSPPSPANALDMGSKFDVPDADKAAVSLALIPDPSGTLQTTSPIMVSIPTFVVVLTNKEEAAILSLSDQSSDSDSGVESFAGSPPRVPSPPPTPSQTSGSSRTKPYSKPEPAAASVKASKVKTVSGAPKVEKKLKKMEQNKTAATRYRQKKRVEQDLLNTECEQLEKRNHELMEKAESISREIRYLTELMEEVRKRRSKTASVA